MTSTARERRRTTALTTLRHHRWTHRLVVASVVLLISAGAIIALNAADNMAPPSADVDCSDAVRHDSDEARRVADACGIDVEIEGERTPWETSWAMADGHSRLVVTATPAATNVNGFWEEIDPSISDEPAEDGMLYSLSPVFKVSFNPGGDEGAALPLAQIEREGKQLELWFPLALGAADIRDTSAVYTIFPGADLTVYVNESGTGFAPVLRLGSQDAADEFRRRLTEVRRSEGLPGSGWDVPFAMKVSGGLRVDVGAGGAFEVLDTSGELAFSAPRSMMWDAAAGEPAASDAPDQAPRVGDVAQPAARGPEPWPGDVTKAMPVRYEDGSIVITPSADFLSDPDTVWPVRIDPTIDGHGAGEWTMLRTGGFTSSVWKFSDISPGYTGGGMGRCSDSSCNATYTARLVWEFSGMSALRAAVGGDVIDAQFRVKGLHSYNCTAQRANLHMTSAISSASTWSSVSWGTQISNRTVAHRESCDNVRYVEYDATAAAKKFADDDMSALALGLKAHDETSMSGWKRLHKSATLQVDYNRAPNTPTVTSLATPAKACATGASAPYINTLTPTIQAKASDPDGDEVGVEFVVVDVATDVWMYNTTVSGRVEAGTVIKRSVPAGKLKDNTRYRYRAKAWDEKRSSSWGVICEFITDITPPPAPALTPVTSGVSAVYTPNTERGGVGLAGKFSVTVATPERVKEMTFASDGTVTPTKVTVSGSGPYTVTFTPAKTGRQKITATAVGRSGLTKSTTIYVDVAGAKEGALWTLDEGAGTTATDTAGNDVPRNLSLSSATWTAGPHALFGSRTNDKALAFDGTDDVAHTAGAPLTTNGAYALSAFVWLNGGVTNLSKDYTALSQDGLNVSGFELGYADSCDPADRPKRGCWAFTLPAGDSATAARTIVTSAAPVVTGQWVHLVADRNAAGTQARLWVCPVGTPAAPTTAKPVRSSVTLPGTGWKADGSFALGRGKDKAVGARWWPGRIDDVRLFPGQVVSEEKVRRLCSGAQASDFKGDQRALDPTTDEE